MGQNGHLLNPASTLSLHRWLAKASCRLRRFAEKQKKFVKSVRSARDKMKKYYLCKSYFNKIIIYERERYFLQN